MNDDDDMNNDAMTVDEFCRSYRISRALFYRLRKDGDAPRTMPLRGRRVISRIAAEAWRQRMEEKGDLIP